ncbi:MAG: hypothetical protein ABFS56_10085 [Pseudomonadota bacterium]
MKEQVYQQMIIDGIQALPQDALAEIADFVYFIRKKILHPQSFQNQIRDSLLTTELHSLSQAEEAHLEQEFADMEKN